MNPVKRNQRMRWIYNLKKMLDKKQKEVVLATP